VHPPREGNAPAGASEPEYSLWAVVRGGGGNHSVKIKCFVEIPLLKKSIAFENVPPTLGIPHGMLQFSVAFIRNSHRGLAVDEKRASLRYYKVVTKTDVNNSL
jgi:hypothetical protein